MGHETLALHLIGNAEGRKAEILGEAREEAGRRIARALAEAEAMECASREAFEREIARERDLRMSRARLEAKEVEVRAQAALAEDVLARLRERLSRVPSTGGYPGVAERLYREILPEIPAGNVRLGADAQALESLGPLLADPRIRRVPLPEDEIGGVEVSDEAGTIRIRNTLKARLENALPSLMAEIHRRLVAADE
jgi:V/A-type H+-transporting ATPase subunit E